jgi:hypothetical protein
MVSYIVRSRRAKRVTRLKWLGSVKKSSGKNKKETQFWLPRSERRESDGY